MRSAMACNQSPVFVLCAPPAAKSPFWLLLAAAPFKHNPASCWSSGPPKHGAQHAHNAGSC